MNITKDKALRIAQTVYKSVNEKQEIPVFNGISRYQLPYLLAKAVLNPTKTIVVSDIKAYTKPDWTYISRDVKQADYLELAGNLVDWVNKNRQLPNYLKYMDYKISTAVYTYVFACILIFYHTKNRYPAYWNFNNKVFVKPTETTNEVYSYFVKVFGSFGDTIDGALSKVDGRRYAYYYDDVYSNKQSIDRIKQGLGVNCTDSCHVFYNIMLALIEKGKYKKVECLHVMCSSGGHVKLRITLNDGSTIIRDPACALSDNGKGYTCNWCTNTPIAVDPDWFMENLKR